MAKVLFQVAQRAFFLILFLFVETGYWIQSDPVLMGSVSPAVEQLTFRQSDDLNEHVYRVCELSEHGAD